MFFLVVTNNSEGIEFAKMDIRKVTSANVIKFLKGAMNHEVYSEYLFYEPEYGRLKSYFFSKELKKIYGVTGVKYCSMHKLKKHMLLICWLMEVKKRLHRHN